MRVIVVVLLLLLAGCANCSDQSGETPEPWTVGEGGEDDVGVADVTFTDAVGPGDDATGPPPPPPPPDGLPTCVDADAYAFEVIGSDFTFAPIVAGDRVFVTGREPDGSGPSELREWTDGGLIARTNNEREMMIITFSESHIWLGSLEGGTQRYSLATNETEDLPFDIDFARSRWNYFYAPVRQSAVGQRVAWSIEDRVHLAEGDELITLGTGPAEAPWVTERVVAYELLGMDRRIRWHVGAEQFEIGPEEDNTWPVVTDASLFFVRNGQVQAVDLTGRVVESVLDDRFCGPLHSDGQTVVTACRRTPPDTTGWSSDYLSFSADEVWMIDASSRIARQIATSEGPIFAPVVSERWIVWAEYNGELGGQPPVTGGIQVYPRGGDEPTEVARIGNGCPYCGAYWPPPRLILGRDTIAWNYAVEAGDEEMFGPRSRYGVARLRPCD